MANFQNHYDVLPNGAFVYYCDAIPSSLTGITFRTGDFCLNVGTSGSAGWACTAGGTPGTWVATGQGANYIGTETGANNAIVGSLSGTSLTVGMRVDFKLAHTLQAGGNTFNFNAGGAVAIKSHFNTANNIGTAYASGAVVPLLWDGTQWQDVSQ